MLQGGQFSALKEREFLEILEILMILSNFKPKKSTVLPFFLEKLSKIHKFGDFGSKNHQNVKKIQISVIFPSCRKLTIL